MTELNEKPPLVNDLVGALRYGSAVIVVGAGVSAAAAGLPNWVNAVKSGIGHLESIGVVAKDELDALRLQMDQARTPEELTVCAESVRMLLTGAGEGSGEFATWLQMTFSVSDSSIQNVGLLRAIHGLPSAMIATTNYDKLLSRTKSGSEGVTWRDSHRLIEALRVGENIVHLHGSWDDPNSVILGRGDYESLYNSDAYRAFMRTLWLSKTLVFVGCSLDGMRDPDFVNLLDWAAATFPHTTVKHYALVRNETYSTDDVDRFLNKWRIQLVPYGSAYDDLESFLNSLSPAVPGASSHVFNVPYLPNPDFTGREDLLAEMASVLNAASATAGAQTSSVVQAIHGMGGVGKTQLAVEYAYRYRMDYDVVWWVRAEESATLSDDFSALASDLDIEHTTDQNGRIDAIRRWLEQCNQRWLIIFDNAVDFSYIEPYIPHQPSGRIIVTTQNRDWPQSTHRLEVGVLDRHSALEYLRGRTGQQDEEAALDLADELGYLPLALAQAAAYIDARGLSLRGYLDRFREYQTELLRRGKLDDYSRTVSTTWLLSFETIADQSPSAIELLRFVSFFAPDAIPLDQLTLCAGHLTEPLRAAVNDQVAFDEAIAALRRYSIVEVTDDLTISVHRLVQEVVRMQLSAVEQAAYATTVVGFLDRAFPADSADPQHWQTCSRLLSHASAIADYAVPRSIEPTVVSRLLNNVGMYLSARALYSSAGRALRRALELQEAAPELDRLEKIKILINLGSVLRSEGDRVGATSYIERALEIEKSLHGDEHPNVAVLLNNLGLLLQEQGDLVNAKIRIEEALSIYRKIHVFGDPITAPAVINLGLVLRSEGDFVGAEGQLELALEILEERHGSDHLRVASVLNNLGLVSLDQHKLPEARGLFERTLKIHTEVLGPEHPMVATAMDNLARVLQEQREFATSKEYYWSALKVCKKVHGVCHPDVATIVSNLATLLSDEGDLRNAIRLNRVALSVRQSVWNHQHPDVATSLNNLATALSGLGYLEEARGYLGEALRIRELVYGSVHREVAIVLENQATLVIKEQAMVEAIRLLKRALRIYESLDDRVNASIVIQKLASLGTG